MKDSTWFIIYIIILLVMGGAILWSIMHAKGAEIPAYNGFAPHHHWNTEKQCYDEDIFRGTFQATESVKEIDPDWVVEMPKPDGCFVYFHPTQGQENAPITDDEKELQNPTTNTKSINELPKFDLLPTNGSSGNNILKD